MTLKKGNGREGFCRQKIRFSRILILTHKRQVVRYGIFIFHKPLGVLSESIYFNTTPIKPLLEKRII